MTIHKEGTASLILTVVTLIIINIGFRYLAPSASLIQNILLGLSIFLFLIVLQFFRKPYREITLHDNAILAPADGKVVVIEQVVEKEYFNDKRLQISIFMSPLNVHINFNPISGIVKYFKYHPGKFLFAWEPKSSTDNERSTIVVEHKNGTEVLFRQVAGALARRLCWYVEKDQAVEQGQEFGFIKFGSRIDIYLPLNAEVCCQIGDKPVGGQTVIARFG